MNLLSEKLSFNLALEESIELLTQENQILNTENELLRSYLLLGVILVVVFGILISLLVYRNYTQKNKANEILQLTNVRISKQAEKYKDVNKSLIQLNEFKDGMTSMIVHDLKHPLNTILNISKKLPSEQQLSSIKQSGRHMLNLVMNILDVNKYENSKMVLHLLYVPIFEIIQNSIHQVQFLANQKHIELSANCFEGYQIKVDNEIILRVFINLLTNAIKYTPVNGKINISSRRTTSGDIQFLVKDNGLGIPKEKEKLVFVKFGQVVAKKSGTVRSSGLGLTFCKLAIEAHKGEIGFEKNKEQGTTFWFSVKAENVQEIPNNELNKIEFTQVEKPKIRLTQAEKKYLTPLINKLKAVEIYNISKLKRELRKIEDTSENIKQWKNLILDASFSLNTKEFNKLLSI